MSPERRRAQPPLQRCVAAVLLAFALCSVDSSSVVATAGMVVADAAEVAAGSVMSTASFRMGSWTTTAGAVASGMAVSVSSTTTTSGCGTAWLAVRLEDLRVPDCNTRRAREGASARTKA